MELGLSFRELMGEQERLLNALITAEEAGDTEEAAQAQMILDEYIQPGIVHKVDSIAYVIQTKLPADIEQLKGYKKQIEAALKTRENALENFKNYLKHQVKQGQLPPSLIGDRHVITISNMTTPTVTVESDPSEWSSEFDHLREIQIKYVALKKQIVEAHTKGQPLPDGVTISYSQRLGVKVKK